MSAAAEGNAYPGSFMADRSNAYYILHRYVMNVHTVHTLLAGVKNIRFRYLNKSICNKKLQAIPADNVSVR